LLVVEYRREDARRVEVRQAAPVDGPVDPDEGDRVQVADDAVGLDRLVAHGSFPLARLRSPRRPTRWASTSAQPASAPAGGAGPPSSGVHFAAGWGEGSRASRLASVLEQTGTTPAGSSHAAGTDLVPGTTSEPETALPRGNGKQGAGAAQRR